MIKFSTDLNTLVQQYEKKEMTITEIADNFGVSAGFVKMYLTAGIVGEAYNPDKCNKDGLVKILKKAQATAEKIAVGSGVRFEIDKFSFDGWKVGEKPQPKIVIDWKIGQKCVFANSHGQQNATCVYEVVWINPGYLLVNPIENLAIDSKGMKIDNPRILSMLVASNMKPTFSAEIVNA